MLIGIIATVIAVGGCQKKEDPAPVVQRDSVEVVAPDVRSEHFEKVTSQLELGGQLFGYMDIDGDLEEYSGLLDQVFKQMSQDQPEMAFLGKVSVQQLSATLGFDGLKALGVSSVSDGNGVYRNRLFLYMPEGRHGLFAGLGGQPGEFQRLNWASSDTDLFSESEVDLPEVYQTISRIIALYGGEEKSSEVENALRNAGQEAALSVLEIIQNWKGRMVTIGRFDGEETLSFPTPSGAVVIPAFSILVAIDGIAPALRNTLDQLPVFTVTETDDTRLYELKQALPISGIDPVFAIRGSTLIFANKSAYLKECLSGVGGLASQPKFQEKLDQLGGEGNGLSYFSTNLFSRLRDLAELNAHLPAKTVESLKMMLLQVPETDHAIMSISINRPDGILVQEFSQRTYKNIVAGLSIYNPMTIGLMSAMAIPAFQKVRHSSQEKAVMNNLRQLSAAADQYYLENGVATTTYGQLVGPEPTKYIRQVQSVAGEDYRTITFRLGEPLRVMVPSLKKVVEY